MCRVWSATTKSLSTRSRGVEASRRRGLEPADPRMRSKRGVTKRSCSGFASRARGVDEGRLNRREPLAGDDVATLVVFLNLVGRTGRQLLNVAFGQLPVFAQRLFRRRAPRGPRLDRLGAAFVSLSAASTRCRCDRCPLPIVRGRWPTARDHDPDGGGHHAWPTATESRVGPGKRCAAPSKTHRCTHVAEAATGRPGSKPRCARLSSCRSSKAHRNPRPTSGTAAAGNGAAPVDTTLTASADTAARVAVCAGSANAPGLLRSSINLSINSVVTPG